MAYRWLPFWVEAELVTAFNLVLLVTPTSYMCALDEEGDTASSDGWVSSLLQSSTYLTQHSKGDVVSVT